MLSFRFLSPWFHGRGDEDAPEWLPSPLGAFQAVVAAAERAVCLLETFIAGCYEKAEEVDGSSGSFGMFVRSLFCDWIRARQSARFDAAETVRMLLAWVRATSTAIATDWRRS